jgi:hypothetical protein
VPLITISQQVGGSALELLRDGVRPGARVSGLEAVGR